MSEFKEISKLNEKEGFTDILTLEKHILNVYSIVMAESVSDGFRAIVNEHLNQTVSDQFSVFLQMTDRGYYKTTTAEEQEVEKTRESFSKSQQQINE